MSDNPLASEDFICDRFGHYLKVHTDLHFPHKHSFFHLVYFTKGAGHHSIDFVKFPVKPGTIYFMIPGQVHTWMFTGDADGYIINFSEQFLSKWLADPRFTDRFDFFSGDANYQSAVLPKPKRGHIENIFETILTEDNSRSVDSEDMIRAALVQLFIQVKRGIGNSSKAMPNQHSSVLGNFKKLIDVHYKSKKLTKDYAPLLFITPNHLNALAKQIAGRSAGEMIRDRVLLEAKRLLINAQLNINEIAADLNFTDNSYFSKFFKKYTGVTPETFRNKFHH